MNPYSDREEVTKQRPMTTKNEQKGFEGIYPSANGYKMPPEWEPHQRTLLSWPVKKSMCHPGDYERVCRGMGLLALAIAAFEPVSVVVCPGEKGRVEDLIESLNLEAASDNTGEQCLYDISFLEIPHNDAWLRDNGPTFVRNSKGELAGVNWRFNAWGGKYPEWDLDDRVAPQILSHYHVPCFNAPPVMEGGSFHTDGEGTLITTEECLLNPNRNPDMSREEIEADLRRYLGIEKVIWLKKGLSGDETDGHVDNLACFASPGKVLLQVCTDPEDENAAITRECLDILNKATDARGRKLEVIPVAQPPRRDYEGDRLTLSYLNFYFVNGGIILPVFGGEAGEADRQAQQTLEAAFPHRKIRCFDGMALIKEGGNVHCTTQQMPVSGV